MGESVTTQAYEELSGDAYEVQGDNTVHLTFHTHKATLTGGSGDIMSQSGRKYFELNAKKLLDHNGKHIFTIKHALVSLHKRMYICDHVGNKLMEIHSENIIQMDASAVLTDLVGREGKLQSQRQL
ncbi:hypothetical protein SARC_07894 [Sphaeroforma arctica JP610]|uniref:Uncharacterized protein n=1 Tax=Sphaeroforma arctica JP610 TaxID=667725 RepID=A0A0L0FSQ8_9EUKA|nr:hypothetical protein SARC_07894 [Sphaeroforma arctica JP610]KNC79719.1 hypothetical protein SARC_07894 [Sphaeroforma arctica JP610]|eukprot:XP_014153621.1 hypothetical protein SARC_07894 [Sphaeroforma arctica JP610]